MACIPLGGTEQHQSPNRDVRVAGPARRISARHDGAKGMAHKHAFRHPRVRQQLMQGVGVIVGRRMRLGQRRGTGIAWRVPGDDAKPVAQHQRDIQPAAGGRPDAVQQNHGGAGARASVGEGADRRGRLVQREAFIQVFKSGGQGARWVGPQARSRWRHGRNECSGHTGNPGNGF
ncbi:hypothetical protein D3C87_1349550 [compost metagenome]